MRPNLDTFTRAYLEAALWSSTDADGEPMDRDHDLSDLAPETLAHAIEDCRSFQETFGYLYAEGSPRSCYSPDEQAGHDFWLTRNHHGAGFWDGDWPEPAATILTDAAHSYREMNLYVGDDGRVYAE